MRNNVLILHGSFGNVFENWFPWLTNKLNELDIQTLTPSFPTPNRQSFESWSNIMNGYLLSGLINKNTIIVCHSASSIFTVRYLIENKLKINTFISVSGFNNFISGNESFDILNKKFFFKSEDCILLRNLCQNRLAILSNNDPYLSESVLSDFANSIDAKQIIIKEGGHFNTANGYLKFDILFEEIKKIIINNV